MRALAAVRSTPDKGNQEKLRAAISSSRDADAQLLADARLELARLRAIEAASSCSADGDRFPDMVVDMAASHPSPCSPKLVQAPFFVPELVRSAYGRSSAWRD